MSLARRAAGSVLWATTAAVVARAFTIVSTFALTRYLTPHVQGEVNLAFVLVATVGAASALGVSQYVASHPAEGRETSFHATVLVLGSGVLACLAVVLAGPEVARWIGARGMVEHIPGLALAHFIERCGWVPRGLLVRQMRFRALGLRVAAAELSFAASSVTLAALGCGGQSIVLGGVVRSTVGLALLLAATERREWLSPCALSAATLRKLLRFGLPMSLSWLFRVGATTWDNTLMGYRFGEATVGVYNQAYRLAEMPAVSIGDACNDVLVPAFARASGPDERRRGFVRAASLITLVVAPIALGLGAVGPALVAVFYPPAYAGVAPLLVVLAPLGLLRALTSLCGAFLQARGRTRSFAAIDGLLAVLVLALVAVLSLWGPVPACAGVVLSLAVTLFLLLGTMAPEGVAISDILVAIARPVLCAVVMAGAVVGLHRALSHVDVPGAVRLVCEIAFGAGVYSAAAWRIAPRAAADLLSLCRSLSARGRPA